MVAKRYRAKSCCLFEADSGRFKALGAAKRFLRSFDHQTREVILLGAEPALLVAFSDLAYASLVASMAPTFVH